MPPNYNSELCTEKNKMKIFEGLSNSKNMVFNVKKLLNVGVSDREVGWCLEPERNGVYLGRGNVGGPGPPSGEQDKQLTASRGGDNSPTEQEEDRKKSDVTKRTHRAQRM